MTYYVLYSDARRVDIPAGGIVKCECGFNMRYILPTSDPKKKYEEFQEVNEAEASHCYFCGYRVWCDDGLEIRLL